jgi:hypothetical protein
VDINISANQLIFLFSIFAQKNNIELESSYAVLCRFHVNVSEEPAPLGVQLFVVIVRVSGMLPVFLM